jgi:hypothetical protein
MPHHSPQYGSLQSLTAHWRLLLLLLLLLLWSNVSGTCRCIASRQRVRLCLLLCAARLRRRSVHFLSRSLQCTCSLWSNISCRPQERINPTIIHTASTVILIPHQI